MRRVRRGPKTLAHLISGTARLCKNRKVQAAVESRPIRLQNALNPPDLRSPAHPRPVAAPAAGGGMSYLAWPRLALYQSAGRAATMWFSRAGFGDEAASVSGGSWRHGSGLAFLDIGAEGARDSWQAARRNRSTALTRSKRSNKVSPITA